MTEKIITTSSNEATSALFGAFDANVRMIETAFDVVISDRNTKTIDGDAILIRGEHQNVEKAARALEYLKHMVGEGETISQQSVEYVIGLVRDNLEVDEKFSDGVICITNRRNFIGYRAAIFRKSFNTNALTVLTFCIYICFICII